MDKNYYFIQEPNGADDGPYVLSEIRRRITLGTVTRQAVLCKVGETEWLPVTHERYAAFLEPPRRPAQGTSPPLPVVVAPSPQPDIPPVLIYDAMPIQIPPRPEPSGPMHEPVFAPPPPYVPPPPVYAQPQPYPQPYPQPRVAPTMPLLPAPAAPEPVVTDTVPAYYPPQAPLPQPQAYVPPMLPAPAMLPAPQPMLAAPPAPPRRSRAKLYAGIGGGAFALAVGIGIAATRGGHGTSGVKDAMVRVTTPSGTGAGFFIDGPDDAVYVATANHVVDRGERVLIERDVGADKSAYVEAYPETEIVAADPDADLAIIRIKNVQASKFARLSLASAPEKDEKILSFGYPGSSLAKHAGLVSKDGKILSLVSFPAYDERYARVLRENAVDGLLISTDIEPGFSGGPTTNESGEVVGINVTKDRAHVGQNGAVSVKALKELIKQVKPAGQAADPTPADVVALLKKVQTEYLLLPLEERSKVRETDFLSAGDLPDLRRLVTEVRREERNTDNGFIAKYKLSGQAALGIYFARLPGNLLETYRAPSTTNPILACELTNQHLTSFLGDLSTADSKARPAFELNSCDELAVRPLAWDLLAATLQWDGKEKDYTVTKVDKVDDEGRVYKASVRISGAPNLIDVWVGMDQGQARLKVFDPTSNLYAIKSPRSVSPGQLQGTWTMKRPRVTDAHNKDAEIEADENLSISIDDNHKVSLRYVVNEKYYSAGQKGRQFRCNHKATIDVGVLQSFTGTLDNGVVVAFPDKEAESIGADASWCEPEHHADRIVAAKLAGDQLYLYRTDGNAYPESVQLAKQ